MTSLKIIIISNILLLVVSSCGKEPEARDGDYRDSILYHQPGFGDVKRGEVANAWKFYGSTNKEEGQKFCDLLSMKRDSISGDDLVFASLTEEQLSIYNTVQNNPDLTEVYDSQKKYICKKEQVTIEIAK